MSGLRIAGVIVSCLLIARAVVGRRRLSLTRGEVVAWLGAGLSIAVVSLTPAAVNPVTSVLQVPNRIVGLAVIATAVLFALRMRDVRRIVAVEERVGALVRGMAVREFRHSVEAGATEPLISVVIAAYNEAAAIEGVLSEMPGEVAGYRVEPIVVVDGASDDTEGVARRAGYLVATHAINRGHGDALRTGFQIAFERGAEVVATMDADGQHDPAELINLVKPIIAGDEDHVQGSRFLGHYDDAGSIRHRGILFFTRVINALTGLNITDSTNGFRAIRAERLADLRLDEYRFPVAELIVESANRGMRIHEVGVHVRRRAHGESKKPKRLRYPLGFLATVVRTWLRGTRRLR